MKIKKQECNEKRRALLKTTGVGIAATSGWLPLNIALSDDLGDALNAADKTTHDNTQWRVFHPGSHSNWSNAIGIDNLDIAKQQNLKSNVSQTDELTDMSPCCDLTIYQGQKQVRDSITLRNNFDTTISISRISTTGLSKSGSLKVKITAPQTPLKLKQGHSLSIDILATGNNTTHNLIETIIPSLVAGKIQIKSNHQALNVVIPVTVFDAIAA